MIYDLVASFYDRTNCEIDYGAWADFIEEAFDRYLPKKPALVLDLACGTGRMTRELAARGYDMTGVDLSAEMLNVARDRAAEEGMSDKILWLLQDMTAFELYGTIGAVVCCLDSINHLTRTEDLKKTFSLVWNYLDPGGLFLFDVNGKRRFETVYANETYTMEDERDFCVWENDYHPKTSLCHFYITLFRRMADGRYRRYDDEQTERMYRTEFLRRTLTGGGFEFLGAFSDFSFTPATEEDERIYIVARAVKHPGEANA